MGYKVKPAIVQHMIWQLCLSWNLFPELSLPYFVFFPDLLKFREAPLNDSSVILNGEDNNAKLHSVMDTSRVIGVDRYNSSSATRVLILQFIENIFYHSNHDAFYPHIRTIMKKLIELNKSKDYIANAIIGSEKYGEKLRSWQALCIMSKYADRLFVEETISDCIDILKHSCVHSIRVHMEIYCSVIAVKFPDIVLPMLMNLLKKYNHSAQVYIYRPR